MYPIILVVIDNNFNTGAKIMHATIISSDHGTPKVTTIEQPKTIGTTTYRIGAQGSLARFKQAKETRGALICGKCLKAHGKNELIISLGKDDCFVCETTQEVCFCVIAD